MAAHACISGPAGGTDRHDLDDTTSGIDSRLPD
jgi:hypothetical protein